MTRPLVPREPAPRAPGRSVLPAPRIALAAAVAAALLCAVLGLAFSPATIGATTRVAAARYSVQMANFAFAPASITVKVGDTITWTNQDSAPHTVTTTSGPRSLNSPYLPKGQSWSYTFTVPGTYQYYCTVHPDMRARVIVEAAAPATTAAARAPAASAHATHRPGVAAAAPGRTSAAPATSSADPAPAAAATNTASATGTALQAQAPQAADVSAIRTVSPVLLLGGLTAAIAVLCLLLVGSRAATAQAGKRAGSDDTDHP